VDLLLHLVLFVVGTALTWKGSDLLESSAASLSTRYRVPDLVRGTLVVAVGSSFPELTTTVVSALVHGDFELGMASVVGSAIFNILVIPGLAGLLGKKLHYDVRLVYRDGQFYLTSVAVLLVAFSFALIYEPVPGRALTGTLTAPIAVLPLLLYGLYLFLQYQERQGSGPAPQAPEAAGDGASTRRESRDWLTLVVSLLLVVAGVEGLLRTAIWLGHTLGTPSFLWGATVVAAATSLPDALISIKTARRGEGDVSVGNVLGSNIFDLLVALPLAVVLVGGTVVDFSVAAPLMGCLTLATIVLFAFLRTQLTLSRLEAWILLGGYGLFVGWLVLETLGVTRTLGLGAAAAARG
jgi:cation:H+ antiporter